MKLFFTYSKKIGEKFIVRGLWLLTQGGFAFALHVYDRAHFTALMHH